MDGRNGHVIPRSDFLLRIPEPLRYLAEIYQRDRGLTSLNASITELLETHPEIAKRAMRVYSEGKNPPKEGTFP